MTSPTPRPAGTSTGRPGLVAIPRPAWGSTVPPDPLTGPTGPAGPPGPAGPAGPQGAPGAAAQSFVYTQATPAATWTITHNLGTMPGVTLVGVDGGELWAEVIYPDTQTTVIVFAEPYVGSAYLRG